jgi:uncharacterized membrane protein
MKQIEFKNSLSQRIYNDYFKRVEKNIKLLSEKDKVEFLMEINSHIYEAMNASSEANETENLLNVLNKLGDPQDFLKGIVADKKLNEAVRTFNPMTVFQALVLNFKRGIVYSLFTVLYLFLFAFVFLIVMKIFSPANTGLFYMNRQFHAFGFVSNAYDLNEILGFWFIPMVASAAILFYFLITLLLRFIKKK